MKKFYAPDDEGCVIDDVNEALEAAGYGDLEIFFDPYNSFRISMSQRHHDAHGQIYYMDQRTNQESPYWWAKSFESGFYGDDDSCTSG